MADKEHRADDRPETDINLEDETELEDWCRSFGCTAEELRAAVKLMGRSTKRVRAYFRDREQAAE